MGKKLIIGAVLILVILFVANLAVKAIVGSTYRTFAFQKNIKSGIEHALGTLGIPVEVRLRGVDADGWDCTIRTVLIKMKTEEAAEFEITNVRLAPEVWPSLFGDQVAAKLTGLLDGQQGTTDIIVTPGLLDMGGGQAPELKSVKGQVSGLGSRWISDFAFAGQPSPKRLRFKDGTLSVRGEVSASSGTLTVDIAKPTWEFKARKRRQIAIEDFQILLEVDSQQMRLGQPVVLRGKPGTITVRGNVATGGGSPNLQLSVQTKGKRLVSMMASQLFRCGRPMPPRFSVSGQPPRLKCQ